MIPWFVGWEGLTMEGKDEWVMDIIVMEPVT